MSQLEKCSSFLSGLETSMKWQTTIMQYVKVELNQQNRKKEGLNNDCSMYQHNYLQSHGSPATAWSALLERLILARIELILIHWQRNLWPKITESNLCLTPRQSWVRNLRISSYILEEEIRTHFPSPAPPKKPNVTLEVATDALILFTTAKITTTSARQTILIMMVLLP